MTPHQLHTFLVVADAGSVSDAAEHLVATQSALSASLAGLQPELGVAGELTVVGAPGTPMRRPWHVVTRAEVPAPARLFLAHLVSQGRPASRTRTVPERDRLR